MCPYAGEQTPATAGQTAAEHRAQRATHHRERSTGCESESRTADRTTDCTEHRCEGQHAIREGFFLHARRGTLGAKNRHRFFHQSPPSRSVWDLFGVTEIAPVFHKHYRAIP